MPFELHVRDVLRSALSAALLAGAFTTAGMAQNPDLTADLAAAVDLATPAKRQAAAIELARREDVELEDWLAACASFAPTETSFELGWSVHEVSLWFDGAEHDCELLVYRPRGEAEPGVGRVPLMVSLHGTGGDGHLSLIHI